MDTKVSANRQKKIQIVEELAEKASKAKALVFTNYQGLTHKQMEGLKRAIKPLEAEYVVAKNSLVLRALDANKLKVEEEKDLDGPTGTLLIYGELIQPLKELAKLIKELGIPSVKFGIMDKERISGDQVLKLSSLPSKEVLLTQMVVGLKSPIFGLHRALNWNLQKLVLTLDAISKSKPAAQSPVLAQAIVETVEPLADEVKQAINENGENTQVQTEELQNDKQTDGGGEN